MKMDAFSEASRFNERIHRLVSAVLISVMMACAGLTVSKVGSQIWPDWQGSYLVVIGFLIALERFYTYRALKKLSTLGREWVVLISTQWVVNLIVIKLFVSLSQGFGALLAEIPLWQRMAAKATHVFIYGFLILNPFVGWVATSAYGAKISVFGLFTMPVIVAKDRALADQLFGVHMVLGILFTATVALHVAAALYHGIVRRDGVLQRML